MEFIIDKKNFLGQAVIDNERYLTQTYITNIRKIYCDLPKVSINLERGVCSEQVTI
jgi:hypothetical protein